MNSSKDSRERSTAVVGGAVTAIAGIGAVVTSLGAATPAAIAAVAAASSAITAAAALLRKRPRQQTERHPPEPEDLVTSVVAVITTPDRTKILLVRRNFSQGKKWSLPAWLVPPGEDPVAFAIAAIKDEFGLECMFDQWQSTDEADATKRLIQFVAQKPVAAGSSLPETQVQWSEFNSATLRKLLDENDRSLDIFDA